MGWDGWSQDVRLAVRALIRRPAFSAVVILTLGAGFGANVAVFSVLQVVLLAPLPYQEAEQLVRIYGTRLDEPDETRLLSLAAPVAIELRDEVPSLSGVAIIESSGARGVDLTGGDRPERLRLLPVNSDYFDVLGWPPVLGRAFTASEEVAEARVAVVREDVWRRHLRGDPRALGQTLLVDGEALTVVGVVSDDVRDPVEGRVDVWIPTDLSAGVAGAWQNNYLTAVGRLGPGADLGSLRSELDLVESRHESISSDAAEKGFVLVPLHEDLVGDSRPVLTAVMGAVLFLLLLTCVNVASLMVARAGRREQELAIRASLGSPRSRLVRSFVIESSLLAVLGAALGVLVGFLALDLILAVAPADLPRREAILLGRSAVTVAGALGLVIGLVLGVATALPFVRREPRPVLVRRSGGGHAPGVRSGLVVIEVALAVVLLSGATALMRTVQELGSQDLGIEASGVLTYTVGLPTARYASDEAIARFNQEFHTGVLAIPGVTSAAVTSRLPVTGSYNTWGTRRAFGPDAPHDTGNMQVNQRWISGEFFETVGLDLLAGRVFDASDRPEVPYRVVVNQTLARALFPGESPVGEWLMFGGRFAEVIGVVEDEALTTRTPPAPMAYHHQRQWISGNRQMTQLVRVTDESGAVLPALREALAAVDPDLILFQPVPLEAVVRAGIEREAFAARMLVAFAALAVLLAGLGLYGVLQEVVGSQRHEIGVRLALGATGSGIVGMVVRRGLRLTVVGAVCGAVLTVLVADTLRTLLFNVNARDPLLMLAAPLVLFGVAAIACYIPARRASRVDPVGALRAE